MTQHLSVDVCIIGGGAAGLSVASGASQLGMNTVLIERGEMGGDCLNYGCVPSKALLAAAHQAAQARRGAALGVNCATPQVDFAAVHAHIHNTIASIAPHDSEARFTGLGVKVIRDSAQFISPKIVQVAETQIKARYFVIATGSTAAIPPLTGLDTVPYFTNETLFKNQTLPEHLLIIGGGAVGIEMAQAHQRLGSQVTLLEGKTCLAQHDPELTAVLLAQLQQEGVNCYAQTHIEHLEATPQGIVINAQQADAPLRVAGSHLLLATGRRPSIEGLGLDQAEVAYTARGITVDNRLRTNQKHIYAIGDVTGNYQLTHIAGYHAGIVIRNMLFKLPAKVDYRALPQVIYTDPELAQVGLTEAAARAQYSQVRVLEAQFNDNDRARAEQQTTGLLKVVTTPKGRVLGAGLVGYHAGEYLPAWSLAISQKLKIGAIANLIAPYPTFSEINKRAASSFYVDKLFSPATKRLVKFLQKF